MSNLIASSRKVIAQNFLLFLMIFFIILIIGLYSQYRNFYQFIQDKEGYINFLHQSAYFIMQRFGNSDGGTYIKMALYFDAHGAFPIYSLLGWPPGQPFALAILYKFTGTAAYPLKMLVTTCLLWSFALLSIYYSIPAKLNIFLKLALAFLPFYFQTFNQWIFGIGLYASEGFSFPLFLIGVSFLIFWFRTQKLVYLIGFSVCMALLAYLRGYFELFGNFLIYAMLSIFLLSILWSYIVKKVTMPELGIITRLQQCWRDRNVLWMTNFKKILIASLIFILILLPWRLHNRLFENTYTWLPTSGVNWLFLWTPSDQFDSMYAQSAVNPACQIKPMFCKILFENYVKNQNPAYADITFFKNISTMMAINYPIHWYFYKIKYFNALWFGSETLTWNELFTKYIRIFIEGTFIFIAGIITLIYGFRQRKNLSVEQRGILFFTFLFLIFNCMLFTFIHFEPRYSLFLRILLLYLPVWIFINQKSEQENLEQI